MMKDVIDVLQLQVQREKSLNKMAPINYQDGNSTYMVVRFIFECGAKLNAHPLTVATAATIYHRFFKEAEKSSYDCYLIASTCLYLAGKMKDEPLKVRDVINVSHNTLHRGSAPLDLNEEYWNMRDAIVQAELLIMRMIKFEAHIVHPHKYMLHYLKSLQGWLNPDDWKKVPLIQASYGFLQDLHYDACILDYKAQHIAVAAINLALQCYGIVVPCAEDEEIPQAWYSVFVDDLSKDKLWELMEKIMDVYNEEPEQG